MFFGRYENGIDAKGRVSVPSDFRAAVANDALNGVLIWKSFNGAFLEGGGEALMNTFAASMERMETYADERVAMERQIFGGMRPLSFDSTGRITLPKDFQEWAGLNGRALFIGAFKRFEIWSPEAYAQKEPEDRSLAFERRNALKPAPPAGGAP